MPMRVTDCYCFRGDAFILLSFKCSCFLSVMEKTSPLAIFFYIVMEMTTFKVGTNVKSSICLKIPHVEPQCSSLIMLLKCKKKNNQLALC